jgi:membrane protein YdbS with pleckstrin-like domain
VGDGPGVAASSAEPIPGASPDETWLHPSPRLSSMRRAQVAALTAAAALVVVVYVAAGELAGGRGVVQSGLLMLLGVFVGGFLLERFAQRRVRAWSYCEREDDLLVHRGVMISRLSVVPYGRMQFIDVVAGPVERAFGLATVRMHTAAAASDARIPGLSRDEAGRLRDRLAERGEARAAGL